MKIGIIIKKIIINADLCGEERNLGLHVRGESGDEEVA